MLNREDLDAMTPEERGRLFDELAKRHYGPTGTLVQLAADFGVSVAAVYRWKAGGVPYAALYTLDAWTQDLNRLLWAAKTASAVLTKALDARASAA